MNLIPESPVAQMVELARTAEGLGFERCWIYDEGLATRDVYVTMAAIAGATDTLRIGPGITNPYTRHVATTAAAVASVDELSGGRAFLGIGAGGSLTLDPLGLARTRPLAAVGGAIDACRALFAGGPVDVDTPQLTLSGARLGYGRPDTEIWLAGRGPRMLALGGAKCDGVMLDFIHKPDLAHTVALVRQAAPRGSRPQISYSTMVVTDQAAMATTKQHMTYRLVDSPASVRKAIGLSDDEADRIRAAMGDGLAAAAEHVREEWVLPFVISGSVESCADELERLTRTHEVDEFLLPVFDPESGPALMATVAQVAGVS